MQNQTRFIQITQFPSLSFTESKNSKLLVLLPFKEKKKKNFFLLEIHIEMFIDDKYFAGICFKIISWGKYLWE